MWFVQTRTLVQAIVVVALLGPPSAEPQPSSANRLPLQTPLTRPVRKDQPDRLSFYLTEGQFAKIVVMQAGTDVVVTLRDPQGKAIMVSDLPNSTFGPEAVAVVAESTGDYVVEVGSGAAGEFTVALETVHNATPADGELARAFRQLTPTDTLRRKRTPETRREATEILNEIQPIFERNRESYSAGWCANMRGIMLAEAGEPAKALDMFQSAEVSFRQSGDLWAEATALNNSGGMLDILGEPNRSREVYSKALELRDKSGDRSGAVQVLNNLGKLEGDLGNWQRALEYYRRALPIAQQLGDTQRQAFLRQNTGAAYLRMGDAEGGIAELQLALDLHRSAKSRRGEADTLQLLSAAHASESQFEKALDFLKQSAEVNSALGDKRQEAGIHRDIGTLYLRRGQAKEAEAELQLAVEGTRAAQDRRLTGDSLTALSLARQLAGRNQDALTPAQEALAELQAIGDASAQSRALEAIARAQGGMGNTAAAIKSIEEALRLAEESRIRTDSQQFRASFFATRQSAYGFYIDLLVRSGKSERALEASERSRARSMLEMLAQAGGNLREGVDPELLRKESEISDLLNAKGSRLMGSPGSANTLRAEIRDLERQYQDIEAEIRKTSPRYASITQPQPLSVRAMQEELLDDDTVLLEYSLGEASSYVWAVDRKAIHTVELPGAARIEAKVGEVLDLLLARSAVVRMETAAAHQKRIALADEKLGPAARELSDLILMPAASFLTGRTVVVVPDGALQRLPFSMLPLRGADPLVVSQEVVTLPSASSLAALRSDLAGRKPASKLLAVFADPVFDRTDPRTGRQASSLAAAQSTRILEHSTDPADSVLAALKIPRLPYTAQEADQILSVARDGSNLKAVGFKASRGTALGGQLADFRYLHFATHGYLDTERPGLSALVLAQLNEKGKPEDGFLRVNDIYNTRLSADLAVLSACQTGLGKEIRGEGLMGLTRAFLYAGVPRVVVSLWNVNDRATAELMAAFYRSMLRGGKRPSTALREAQLELRKQKKWESPYFWAAFVEQGEWR